MSWLFVQLQYWLPQHFLSRLTARLARSETAWLKNSLIRLFIRQYRVNMDEAVYSEPEDYRHFNDFFTRPLKPGSRPLDDSEEFILSPADGAISQLGDCQSGRIFQAKGQQFTVEELLGDQQLASAFENGKFATVYLSPKDYHRVHMPAAGKLLSSRYIPGALFSVNDTTAARVPGLFARNERLVCEFETVLGPMVVVLVGAMIVAGIETVWQSSAGSWPVTTTDHSEENRHFDAGDELGRFYLGSTAIILFERDRVTWSNRLQAGSAVQMGQAIASRTDHRPST